MFEHLMSLIYILAIFLFVVYALLSVNNFYQISSKLNIIRNQILKADYIDDLRVSLDKFSNGSTFIYKKLKEEAFGINDINSKLELALKIDKEYQPVHSDVAKIRLVTFNCYLDPAKFIFLSIFKFEYPFLVIITKCGNKYIYYFNYQYSKPVLHRVNKDDSVFSFVSQMLANRHLIAEDIIEKDLFVSQNEKFLFNHVLYLIHFSYFKSTSYYNLVTKSFSDYVKTYLKN